MIAGSDAAHMMVVKRGHDVCVPTGNIAKRSHARAGKVIHRYRATWMYEGVEGGGCGGGWPS